MINTGWLLSEVTDASLRTVSARVYYDAARLPMGSGQPLVNGPGGYCLEVTNPFGVTASVVITGPGKADYLAAVLPILPLLLPTRRTAAELALGGFVTRADISSIQVVF